MEKPKDTIIIKGTKKQLEIMADDKLALKLAMLFEVATSDSPVKEIAEKYGYTREHYHRISKDFRDRGSESLIIQKTGPKQNRVRKDQIIIQIIRYRYLDPDASAGVIAQKMKQDGYPVSKRSVERTITEYGLQKKGFTSLILKRRKIKNKSISKKPREKKPQ